MIHFLTSLLAFIFALGVIVFIHELGHLLVAKLFDTRVKTFSLGFGTRLWGFERGETDYRVSLIPLGGYVALGGENPEDATGDPREFLSKPRWQRVLVYLAGPAMNALLSIGLVAVLLTYGAVVPDLTGIEPVLGEVEQGSTAAAAGLEAGDIILAVNGQSVGNWQEIAFAFLPHGGKPVELLIDRQGREQTLTATLARDPEFEQGYLDGIVVRTLPQIQEVSPGSPAERAGLRAGDVLRSIDGRPITSIDAFVQYVRQHAGDPVALEVQRTDGTARLTVIPEDNGGNGQVGVSLAAAGLYKKYGVGRAIVESARYNWGLVRQIGALIGKLATGQLSVRGSLAGPIEIAKQSGDAARRGPSDLVLWIAFISINIGLLNLLPIPILDGGQVLILLVESTMRRDLPLRAKEIISQVGFVLILLLMLMVIWFDVSRRLPDGLLPG